MLNLEAATVMIYRYLTKVSDFRLHLGLNNNNRANKLLVFS